MRKQIVALVAVFCTLAVTLTGMPEAAAHHKNEQKVEKILCIPHDNRPISDKQTAEVISKLGYEVVVPPDNMLGSRTDLGHPDELWDWLKQNAQDADAAAQLVHEIAHAASPPSCSSMAVTTCLSRSFRRRSQRPAIIESG